MNPQIQAAIRAGFVTPSLGRAAWTWPIRVPKRIDGNTLDILLGCLTTMNEEYLRANPNTPRLYHANVFYGREPVGQEQWLTIPFALISRDRGGPVDCEDLACWRAAELRVKDGENAKAFWTRRRSREGKYLYHIKVRRASGKIEDPSYILGMNSPEFAAVFGASHSITNGDRY